MRKGGRRLGVAGKQSEWAEYTTGGGWCNGYRQREESEGRIQQYTRHLDEKMGLGTTT